MLLDNKIEFLEYYPKTICSLYKGQIGPKYVFGFSYWCVPCRDQRTGFSASYIDYENLDKRTRIDFT